MNSALGFDTILTTRTPRARALAAAASALLVAAAGCDSPPPELSAPPAAQASALPSRPGAGSAAGSTSLAGQGFGAPLHQEVLTPLGELMQAPERYGERPVKTEGLVTAVCKSMGCWMELGDSGGKVHVKMAGHAFLVPKTANGHRALVEGRVVPSAPPACGDGCREATAGPQASLEFEATGVRFLD